jgi:hypothetical protein
MDFGGLGIGEAGSAGDSGRVTDPSTSEQGAAERNFW